MTAPRTAGGRNPPPSDLTQLRVGHLDLEREPWDPHVELQLSAQVPVGEVHHHLHFALHLLTVDENVVTPFRHLGRRRRRKEKMDVILLTHHFVTQSSTVCMTVD